MEERFTELARMPENQYCAGAPVLIAGSVLHRDNFSGKTVAQIIFRNISEKRIKALRVSISAFDGSGMEMEGVAEYLYLDLSAGRNMEFGQNQTITLPDDAIRRIAVKCRKVYFADGSSWSGEADVNWMPLPPMKTIEEQLGELASQYQRDTSFKSKYVPLEQEDIWVCSCGAVNHAEEFRCYSCRHRKDLVFDLLDVDILRQREAAYNAAEEEKTALRAEAYRKRNAKNRIRAILTAAIAVVVLLTAGFLFFNGKYQNAMVLLDEGKDLEAYNTLVTLWGYRDSAEKADEIYRSYEVGDCLVFGEYEQDNNTNNGKEPIEWIILEKRDGNFLVISKYALDCRLFDKNRSDVTWETSSVREWLNRDFLKAAFTEEERTLIIEVTVPAGKNPKHNTDPGAETQDHVFLLSIDEAQRYFGTQNARKCVSTAYAAENGAYASRGYCGWWLRSPGSGQVTASSVDNSGKILMDGGYVFDAKRGLRPAVWIGRDNSLRMDAENEDASADAYLKEEPYETKPVDTSQETEEKQIHYTWNVPRTLKMPLADVQVGMYKNADEYWIEFTCESMDTNDFLLFLIHSTSDWGFDREVLAERMAKVLEMYNDVWKEGDMAYAVMEGYGIKWTVYMDMKEDDRCVVGLKVNKLNEFEAVCDADIR